MMELQICFLLSLSLLHICFGLLCIYTLPESPDSNRCVKFDLTLLSHFGPYNYTPSTGVYTFYLKVCDIITTDMPDVCVTKKPAPAYKYSSETGECHILGNLINSFAYPLDPLNISRGISISYSEGEGGVSGYWQTSIIFDLHCDSSGVQTLPSVSYEWPSSTYRVTWNTGYACPQVDESETCSWPKLPQGWDGLRFRSYPEWFNKAKFGILVTWGLFSVPAYGNESYWKNLREGDPDIVKFHNRVFGCSGIQPDKYPCKGPSFKFKDFAPMFKAESFDPNHWADLFQRAGAKYVIFTTKHHSGWCNFPSKQHLNWNSKDSGPHLDLTANLTASVRAKGLKMGFYHSLKEWYNPLYEKDIGDNCKSTLFVDEILTPTLKDLVINYKPDIVYADAISDDECSQDSIKYWKSDEFLYWLYNESPVNATVITNSNWGYQSYGSYYDVNSKDALTLRKYKWEFPYGIQMDSFGYDRKEGPDKVWNTTHLLQQMVTTVANNGNFLLNIGPMANGTLDPLFEERLREIGEWMNVNGEAIYNTIPWKHQSDSSIGDIWYTASLDWFTVYAISFQASSPRRILVLKQPRTTHNTKMSLLSSKGDISLSFHYVNDDIHIELPKSLTSLEPLTIKMKNIV